MRNSGESLVFSVNAVTSVALTLSDGELECPENQNVEHGPQVMFAL
jgi:hypothetical protein